mmetsp:Transcript_11547/g.10002  ORF Transcript_11547/g.10002 Transcript_11547/m.10002 type:complete len:144 (+) Transcript_11547:961-1392(+)
MPITKEEYAMEKARINAILNKPIKKVFQAKMRKKFKLNKRLKKTEKKAQEILDQDGVDEGSKMKEIQKMYKKVLRTKKKDKKYIVSKSFSAKKSGGKKAGRDTRIVDSRLKKDKRADKRNAKIDKTSKKIKKSSRSRHAKRRK